MASIEPKPFFSFLLDFFFNVSATDTPKICIITQSILFFLLEIHIVLNNPESPLSPPH